MYPTTLSNDMGEKGYLTVLAPLLSVSSSAACLKIYKELEMLMTFWPLFKLRSSHLRKCLISSLSKKWGGSKAHWERPSTDAEGLFNGVPCAGCYIHLAEIHLASMHLEKLQMFSSGRVPSHTALTTLTWRPPYTCQFKLRCREQNINKYICD